MLFSAINNKNAYNIDKYLAKIIQAVLIHPTQ